MTGEKRRLPTPRESEQDLENERQILCALSAHLGLDYELLNAAKYVVDAALHDADRKVKYIAEVKKRTVPAGQYPDILLSTHKVAEGLRQSAILRCEFLFAVEWTNARGYIALTHGLVDFFDIRIAGSHRGDAGDIEPCYKIPINECWVRF